MVFGCIILSTLLYEAQGLLALQAKIARYFFLIMNVILPSIYCWIYFSQENEHNIYRLGYLLVWVLCLYQCNCEFGQCYYFNPVLSVFAAAEVMLSSDIVVSLKSLVLLCCLVELKAFIQIFQAKLSYHNSSMFVLTCSLSTRYN